MDQSHVTFENLAGAKLIRQTFVRRFLLGNDHESGSVFVQAMDDAGANVACASREFLEVISQGVGERSRVNTGGRMDHETRGLVNQDQEIVFKDDIQRDVFGRKTSRGW